MKSDVIVSGKNYQADLMSPVDISIPLLFDGPQPNFFGVYPASAKPYETNGFIGDTRQGGSCNVKEYKLISHCNGTHTECVGHIVNQNIFINTILQEVLIPATLITINAQAAKDTSETYIPKLEDDDWLITKGELIASLANSQKDFLSGLVIRTVPNEDSKKFRNYSQLPAPFFTIEAIEYLNDLQIKHLVVDIPSVDRANDQGKMTIHHLFWGVEQGSHDINKNNISNKTITEMVFIPDEVKDGYFLLNIQIPSFTSDAAPSRPVLFNLNMD